jgi:hypothetical protein
MTTHILCPSGLQADVRHLKGKEINLFSNEEVAKAGKTIEEILNACVVEVTDHGPYAQRKDEFSWPTALTGDRTYAALQIRIATYLEMAEWPVPCINPACDKPEYLARVDLSKDLKIQSLSEESARKFAEGLPFEVVLPHSGLVVKYHLQTGKDETKAAALSAQEENQGQDATIGLALRIDEIETIHVNDTLRFLSDAHAGDLLALEDAMEATDCGVDTMVPTTCPACKDRRHRPLPLASDAFWFPSSRSRRTR